MAQENLSQLIDDDRLFPRSEYYTRFIGTTAYAMDDPDYWGTYHRSESTRFFSIAGGRNKVEFTSDCAKKPAGKVNSFYAHTGGILSPFNISNYQKVIKLSEQVPEGNKNVRDLLLLYKRQMAETIVASFEKEANDNSQKIKLNSRSKKYYLRPIVFYENNYPCVLIKLPVLNPVENQTEATAYWADHPKPFQRLLLASLVAIVNVMADSKGIPIETVIRASFGHNIPSVCETDNTFRINVGVIPKCYAKLIGQALHYLNEMVSVITDDNALEATFSAAYFAKVRHYNAIKLKNAIDKWPRYKKLIETRDYLKATESNQAFDRLYESFCEINEQTTERKGRSNFKPVRLQGETVWQVIREHGDSMGKSVLAECFRKHETVDWFANQVMNALFDKENKDFPIEVALQKLISYLEFEDNRVTMNYKKIHRDLRREKRTFDSLSFKSLYKKDPAFDKITCLLFEAFCAERPNEALYAELEHAGAKFFSKARGSKKVQKNSDFGSDSEFSDDFTDTDTNALKNKKQNKKLLKKKIHFYHGKLRVCAGMKAIVLAHYGALSYLRENGVKTHRQDIEQMYYEVGGALEFVLDQKPALNKVRAKLNDSILYYDLNHCNATNAADNATLAEKLSKAKPSIVVLDYTSSTVAEVKEAAKKCIRKGIELVMMVDSGLKNSQGGQDYNPYGEVRVLTRNAEVRESILETMKRGLSEKDKLSPQAHEMVRACKRRGLALSLYGMFKGEERFQAVELPEDMLKDSLTNIM